ncbi:MAG TPA: CADD family putative folate metabolism protein [Bryobacteraceae bacterium]|nr:CADD family putative folate metabolism protein [Bryobacteraceae bacterium]
MTTIAAIDEQIAARSLLAHPFYQAWTRGELTPAALKDYAIQYYRHVEAFPTYLSALHSHTADAATRRRILQNLMDEEAGSPNHPELWMQFAEAVGASEAEVRAAEPWDETRNLVGTFLRLCRDGATAEGLAALYSYETQIPAVAASKIDGLKRFYGHDSRAALEYFIVHEEADVEHSAVEHRLLNQHLNDNNADAVKHASAQALHALWEMLSGVCRRHNMEC